MREMVSAWGQAGGGPPPEEQGVFVRAPPKADRKETLAALYDRYGAGTYRYLLALLGDRNEAEDGLQAVFLELARRPELLERIESPAAYLLAAARRIALRNLRRAGKRRQSEEAASAERILATRCPDAPDPAETMRLQQALLSLPLEQREVIVLKIFEEMTFEKIGSALKISPNTAASRYRYALAKLRALLRPDEEKC